MKIGIIQNVTLNDHRSVHSHSIACELVKRGYTVDCILQKTNEPLQYVERPYNLLQIPGDTYTIKGQLKFMLSSLNIIEKGKYDIIHAKNPFSSLITPVILKKLKKIESKLLYDIRGLWIDFGVESHRILPLLAVLLQQMEKIVAGQCDALIAISPTLKEILSNRGYDAQKISVIIGAGVDIPKIHSLPPLKKREGITIGYIGTISTARQSEKIIEAFKKINRPETTLIMIGPIIEPQVFSSLTKDDPNIHLTGFLPQEEALRYLKSCDIALSYHDTDAPEYNVAVPTKILEYMAADIPIVATDHAMYKNILQNEKTALLTRQTPEDFARGITHLLDNPSLAQEMAKNAYKKARTYSVERVVDQLEKVYNGLV
jgi:glycosyltransferase involved in cell wall biosynthesis